VAAAYGRHLGRDVAVVTTPRDRLAEGFRAIGFSDVAAQSYARMTEATIDGTFPADPRRGRITLDDYIAGLIKD
jgi:hypothetical protein